MKKAFLTGATGQDGSYLTELLLNKGYEVHATIRRSSIFNTKRIDHLLNNKNFYTHWGDLPKTQHHGILILWIPVHIFATIVHFFIP